MGLRTLADPRSSTCLRGTVASLLLSTAPAALAATLTLNPAVTRVEGGATLPAVLTAAGEGGTIFTLTSSNSSAASVPSRVTIPTGASSVTFDIHVGFPSADTVVTISASGARGLTTASRTFTVLRPPTLNLNLPTPRQVLGGGSVVVGSINFNRPAEYPEVPIFLFSSSPAVTFIDAAGSSNRVRMTQGSQNRELTLQPQPVTVDTTVAITAQTGNPNGPAVGLDQESLTVVKPHLLAALSVVPTSLGGAGTGTVALDVNALADTAVALAASNPILQLAPTVTVRRGGSQATFPVNFGGLSNRYATVTVTATLNGSQRQAPVLLVGTGLLSLSIPNPIRPGVRGQLVSGLAAPQSVQVGLSSSNPSALSLPPTLVLPSGQRSVSFDLVALQPASNVTVDVRLGTVLMAQATANVQAQN